MVMAGKWGGYGAAIGEWIAAINLLGLYAKRDSSLGTFSGVLVCN